MAQHSVRIYTESAQYGEYGDRHFVHNIYQPIVYLQRRDTRSDTKMIQPCTNRSFSNLNLEEYQGTDLAQPKIWCRKSREAGNYSCWTNEWTSCHASTKHAAGD